MQEKLENAKPFNPQYFAIFCMERSSLLLRPSKKVSMPTNCLKLKTQ